MSTVSTNLEWIRKRMHAAGLRSGRDSSSVRLVGVTKTVPVERIRDGVAAGVSILGENYIQEARKKKDLLADLPVSWHFIGHLQSNKAKYAVEFCDCVHSVDRLSLAVELGRQAQKREKRIAVLIQVNVGDETTKSGVRPENLPELFQSVRAVEGLEVRGLMALPPYFEDAERVRPYFSQMRTLLENLRQSTPEPDKLTELSMGMSNDFEVAIEEGATLVRVGTALFGERPAIAKS